MPQLADKARQLEDLGYAALLLPDHLESPLAPLPALAAVAEVTSRIHLGTLVLAADLRNPAILAKDLATIDLLSDHRFELGIGAGWLPSDYLASGIDFEAPSIRIARLEEQVRLLRSLTSGQPVHHEGHFYRSETNEEQAKVLQADIPILMAGGGKKVLTAAARNADIIGVNVPISKGVLGAEAIAEATDQATDERIRWIKDAAGDRFDEIELSVSPLAIVTDQQHEVAARIGTQFGQSAEHILTSPLFLIGPVDQLIDQVVERRARFGFSYLTITGGGEETFAPVVSALTGH